MYATQFTSRQMIDVTRLSDERLNALAVGESEHKISAIAEIRNRNRIRRSQERQAA